MDFITSTPNPFVIEELEHNIRKQQILISQESVNTTDFYALDSEMHSIWFTDRKCKDLWNLIQQQEIHYTRFRMLDFVETQKYSEISGDHVILLNAIKNNETENINSILGRHLNGGLRRMGIKVLNQYSSYFKEPKDESYWAEYNKKYFD